MYFGLGGGSLKGVSRPGEVVWSRVYVMDGGLHVDMGRATAVELPEEETERRLRSTTPQWPIMHAVLHGVSRDQLMARHKANHINVVYAPDPETADKALAAKAAMFDALGISVHICGDVDVGEKITGWWTGGDLNPRPLGCEPSIHTTELPAQGNIS